MHETLLQFSSIKWVPGDPKKKKNTQLTRQNDILST